MSAPDTATMRDHAYRSVEDLDERVHTTKALEGCIRKLARNVYDLADAHDAALTVAHAAWHLLDDSGESETEPDDDNGNPVHMFFHSDYERLSAALDALEATGWVPHRVGAEGQA